MTVQDSDYDRLLRVLEGGPKVVGWSRVDDGMLRLEFSFRGCDDDAFTILAEPLSVEFDLPGASA